MKPCFVMFIAVACLGGLIPSTAQSQQQTVDFAKDPNTEVRFLPAGMAQEIPLQGLIQLEAGEKRYTLEAILPEAGRFEVVMHRAGKVTLENVKTEARPDGKGYRGQADFVVQIKRLSPDQARRDAEQAVLAQLPEQHKKARQERQKKKPNDVEAYLAQQRAPKGKNTDINDLYEKYRTAQLGRDVLHDKLQQFMEAHPTWFNKSDIEAVKSMSGPAAMNEYRNLLALVQAEAYLREMGLTFETNRGNFREVISRHLVGIDAILGGSNDEERGKGIRSLPQATRDDLLAAIRIEASLRFFPAADEADPNSQWFHAQQVQCRVRGIGTVRLEGRLDPGGGDQSDWWVLSGLDREQLEIDWPRTGLRYELFDEQTEQVKLRLVATSEQAVDYTIEFTSKSATPGARKVVIIEAPARPEAQFPF